MKAKIFIFLVMSLVLVGSAIAKEEKSLESLIVTAQKTEENIQDVPISLTVFDEYAIEDRNIKSVKDIALYTPNLYLANPGDFGSLSPSVRGLSSDATFISTTVSMYIDGVPTLNTVAYDSVLDNIERIEVLKGPQGTLYGKNAEAGVINIVTKKPGNKLKGKVGVEIGSDNKRQYSLSVSGPLVKNKFYIGASGRHYEKDGFVENTYLGRCDNDRENRYGKVFLRYTPTDSLDISLISSKFKRDDGSPSINTIAAVDKRKVATDINGFTKNETTTHSLKIEYDFANYSFESITSEKEDEIDRFVDWDYSPMEYYHSYLAETFKNRSQEFKLSSKSNSLSWLVGLYADKGEKKGGFNVLSMDPRAAGETLNNLDDESIGVFTHFDYKINDKLSILGGLRYDKDKREIDDKNQDIQLDFSYSEVSPKLAVEYNLSNDIMTYATMAKGYKSGGFYLYAPPGYSKKYDKETLWNYEIGLKSSFFNNALILNGSVYYMDISDMQVLSSVGKTGKGYVSNAAGATSIGFELEADYKVSKELSLFFAFGYNDTTFDKFSDSQGDYEGNYNPNAPKYNYSIGGRYRHSSGFFTRVDLNGYGKMYLDKANKYEQDAYYLLNAKIGYELENFDLYFYAKNLFDKEYDMEGAYNGYYTMLSDPKETGIQFAYRF